MEKKGIFFNKNGHLFFLFFFLNRNSNKILIQDTHFQFSLWSVECERQNHLRDWFAGIEHIQYFHTLLSMVGASYWNGCGFKLTLEIVVLGGYVLIFTRFIWLIIFYCLYRLIALPKLESPVGSFKLVHCVHVCGGGDDFLLFPGTGVQTE